MTIQELLSIVNALIKTECVSLNSEILISYDNGYLGSIDSIDFYDSGELRIVMK